MKILAVTQDENFNGGANRSFFMVLKNMKKMYGTEIVVLLPGDGQLKEAFEKENIRTICYSFKGVVSAMRGDNKDLLRKIKVPIMYTWENILGLYLSKKLKREKFDLVYTNTRLPFVGAKIAKCLNIPHIIHIREFGSTRPIWGKWNYARIAKMSKKIIVISNALYSKIVSDVDSSKLVMIHNGIDSDMNVPCHEVFNGNVINMILTGRIVPDKGHMDAIKALEILNNEESIKKKYILHIVGSPNKSLEWYFNDLKKYIADHGLQEYVVFHGEINDMQSIRKEMDMELVCSICETFGRVTVEGMRNGLLVIGSNTGGTVEIINDDVTGLLYQQGDPVDLASKISFAVDNNDMTKRIIKEGYLFSQQHFTCEENVEKIYQVFNEALDK